MNNKVLWGVVRKSALCSFFLLFGVLGLGVVAVAERRVLAGAMSGMVFLGGVVLMNWVWRDYPLARPGQGTEEGE